MRVPARRYDELYQRAQRAHLTVPEMIRRAIARDCRRAEQSDDEE